MHTYTRIQHINESIRVQWCNSNKRIISTCRIQTHLHGCVGVCAITFIPVFLYGLCICVCVCLSLSLSLSVRPVYPSVHVYVCTCVRVCLCSCVRVWLCACVYVSRHVWTDERMHESVYIPVPAYACVCLRMPAYACVCLCSCLHACMQEHVFACVCV